jgi:hypothetical protein
MGLVYLLVVKIMIIQIGSHILQISGFQFDYAMDILTKSLQFC